MRSYAISVNTCHTSMTFKIIMPIVSVSLPKLWVFQKERSSKFAVIDSSYEKCSIPQLLHTGTNFMIKQVNTTQDGLNSCFLKTKCVCFLVSVFDLVHDVDAIFHL